MDQLEAQREPLRGGVDNSCRLAAYKAPSTTASEWRKQKSLQGPKKAIRLCLLGLILPGLFIAVPLYLKHRVYDYQVYPIGMSDMRLIDNRVSTTWCQRQLVKSNATFNAFLMSGAPTVAPERTSVSMTRNLQLSDDMKEYWGFYLLKGSTVTVSTCARWPGASLILIRGHRHLHECAYIGDDSSEELEELMEIVAEGGTLELPQNSSDADEASSNPSNRVEQLIKHRPEVNFHDPRFDPKLKQNPGKYVFQTRDSDTDEELANTKQMRDLLSVLSYKAAKAQKSRDNIPEQERQQRFEQLKAELVRMQHDHPHVKRVPTFGANEDALIKFEDSLAADDMNSTLRRMSSKELMEGVLRKLKVLGTKGERVLGMLQMVDKSTLLEPKPMDGVTAPESKPETSTTIPAPKKLQTEQNKHESGAKLSETRDDKLLRQKRDLIMKTLLTEDFNSEDEEKNNLAIEEGYVPDGIADHHQVINETTLNDRSNSEFWSSFSSSEEALLNCAGLILSLPLNPHRSCGRHSSDGDFAAASLANKITYSVPTNGYYFFVFNSENEVQENHIRVEFNLEKTVYDVSNPVRQCSNATEQCDLPLSFFSNQKVVFELPVKPNETRWNEEFLVVSECEPRTSVYLLCVLAVPLLILFFAFQ